MNMKGFVEFLAVLVVISLLGGCAISPKIPGSEWVEDKTAHGPVIAAIIKKEAKYWPDNIEIMNSKLGTRYRLWAPDESVCGGLKSFLSNGLRFCWEEKSRQEEQLGDCLKWVRLSTEYDCEKREKSSYFTLRFVRMYAVAMTDAPLLEYCKQFVWSTPCGIYKVMPNGDGLLKLQSADFESGHKWNNY